MKNIIAVLAKPFLIIFMSAVLLVAPVTPTFAATTLDLVTERIEGDYEEIDMFMLDTSDPNISTEQFIIELEELEQRLLESEELYAGYTITDPSEKDVEPEIRQITNGLIETRKGVQALKTGVQNNDQIQIDAAYAQLESASDMIATGSLALESKIDTIVTEEQNTEWMYIVGTIVALGLTAATFVARQRINKEKEPLHFEALHRLFIQSLVPLAGVAITLGTYEYAKYSGGSTYTIPWGLMGIGLLYFIVEAIKYLFVVRPKLKEMNEVGIKQEVSQA